MLTADFCSIRGAELRLARIQKLGMLSTGQKPVKRSVKNCIVVKDMSDAKPVRCQRCGKPLGYVTVLAKGLTPLSQSLQNVKIVAICMECSQREK